MNLKVNKNNGKYLYCAACCKPLEDVYFTLTDAELFNTLFIELDGSDNAFCGVACACEIANQGEADNVKI